MDYFSGSCNKLSLYQINSRINIIAIHPSAKANGFLAKTLRRIEYNTPTSFSLRDVVGIRPTTEKNLKNYVEFYNNIERKIEKLDREKK